MVAIHDEHILPAMPRLIRFTYRERAPKQWMFGICYFDLIGFIDLDLA